MMLREAVRRLEAENAALKAAVERARLDGLEAAARMVENHEWLAETHRTSTAAMIRSMGSVWEKPAEVPFLRRRK